MVVGALQSFKFFRQATWFLENNRALSQLWYGILHYLITLSNYRKSVHKNTIL